MIVADTGAVLALLDAGDAHHAELKDLFVRDPTAWRLPWAILPEVDYLAGEALGPEARRVFFADVARGSYQVEWGTDADLARARAIDAQYADLDLGLVEAVVIATAERLRARAIATTDLRHFGAVALPPGLRIIPRDALH